MTKKLGRSPKESGVSVQSEARELLWGAIPQQLGDNRKSWIARAARVLDWNPRRVRAVWNGEARIIRAEEMRQLEDDSKPSNSAQPSARNNEMNFAPFYRRLARLLLWTSEHVTAPLDQRLLRLATWAKDKARNSEGD